MFDMMVLAAVYPKQKNLKYILKTKVNKGSICVILETTKVHSIQVIKISILDFIDVVFELFRINNDS